VRKVVRIEISPELLVENQKDVPVELGRHAGGVVVGRDEAPTVLDEVGTEEERVVTRHRAVEIEEEPGPTVGVEVADGPTQERHEASTLGGDGGEMLTEVADHQVDGECAVLGRQ
jgi:hypothetical protein